MPVKAVDFFCGCGGLSLGLEEAGIEVVAAYDNWHQAVETYNRNLPHEATLANLRHVNDRNHAEMERLREMNLDLVAGGPPCQDFSSAGKRLGSGESGNLTPLFGELVVKLDPEWVLMENVNTIKSIGERMLVELKDTLEKAGYGVTVTVLNAAEYGVPQNRRRLFLIARRGGKEGEMVKHLEWQKKEKVTVREYFQKNGLDLGNCQYYYRHPRTYGRRGIFGIDEPSPTIRGVNRPIPKTYRVHKGDAQKDLSKVRPLTSEERALIQSFPPDFTVTGSSKHEVEQQIGNAVPPLLAEAVSNAILSFKSHNLMRYDDS